MTAGQTHSGVRPAKLLHRDLLQQCLCSQSCRAAAAGHGARCEPMCHLSPGMYEATVAPSPGCAPVSGRPCFSRCSTVPENLPRTRHCQIACKHLLAMVRQLAECREARTWQELSHALAQAGLPVGTYRARQMQDRTCHEHGLQGPAYDAVKTIARALISCSSDRCIDKCMLPLADFFQCTNTHLRCCSPSCRSLRVVRGARYGGSRKRVSCRKRVKLSLAVLLIASN